MQHARRRCTGLIIAVLVVASCGGGDVPGESSSSTASATDSSAAGTDGSSSAADSSAAFSSDLCAVLDHEEPPPNFADLVPPTYADTMQVLIDISGSDDFYDSITPGVIDRLANPETGVELAAFADAAEQECGPSESVDGIRHYAQISDSANPQVRPGYCDRLTTVLTPETYDDKSVADLAATIDIAPAQHIEALRVLQTLAAANEIPVGLDPTQTSVALGGLGLYAEARCGVTDSFYSMMIAGAFLFADDGSASQPAQDLGTVPEPADPAAATALLPAGSDLTFEVIEIDVEEDGDYIVSAVVPTGWEREDSLFGSVFEPTDAFRIFTEMTIDSGCNGLCEVTDWVARLSAPDGFITLYREEDELITDRPTNGTPGIVMARPAFGDGVEGVVIRWAANADRYFTCDFRLGEEDLDFVDAFIAACEAARPGWITAP